MAELPDHRECCRCGVVKPISDYHWREKHKNRRQYFCKTCGVMARAAFRRESPASVKASKRKYHEENRDKINADRRRRHASLAEKRRNSNPLRTALVASAVCGSCSINKPATEFYCRPISKNGLNWACKECVKAASCQWAKSNKEQASARRHRRRALTKGSSLTKFDLVRIRAAQSNRCAACSVQLSEDAEIDHIIPLSKGGLNVSRNIQWLCRFCNRSKHNRDPLEFMRSRGRLL